MLGIWRISNVLTTAGANPNCSQHTAGNDHATILGNRSTVEPVTIRGTSYRRCNIMMAGENPWEDNATSDREEIAAVPVGASMCAFEPLIMEETMEYVNESLNMMTPRQHFGGYTKPQRCVLEGYVRKSPAAPLSHSVNIFCNITIMKQSNYQSHWN